MSTAEKHKIVFDRATSDSLIEHMFASGFVNIRDFTDVYRIEGLLKIYKYLPVNMWYRSLDEMDLNTRIEFVQAATFDPIRALELAILCVEHSWNQTFDALANVKKLSQQDLDIIINMMCNRPNLSEPLVDSVLRNTNLSVTAAHARKILACRKFSNDTVARLNAIICAETPIAETPIASPFTGISVQNRLAVFFKAPEHTVKELLDSKFITKAEALEHLGMISNDLCRLVDTMVITPEELGKHIESKKVPLTSELISRSVLTTPFAVLRAWNFDIGQVSIMIEFFDKYRLTLAESKEMIGYLIPLYRHRHGSMQCIFEHPNVPCERDPVIEDMIFQNKYYGLNRVYKDRFNVDVLATDRKNTNTDLTETKKALADMTAKFEQLKAILSPIV